MEDLHVVADHGTGVDNRPHAVVWQLKAFANFGLGREIDTKNADEESPDKTRLAAVYESLNNSHAANHIYVACITPNGRAEH